MRRRQPQAPPLPGSVSSFSGSISSPPRIKLLPFQDQSPPLPGSISSPSRINLLPSQDEYPTLPGSVSFPPRISLLPFQDQAPSLPRSTPNTCFAPDLVSLLCSSPPPTTQPHPSPLYLAVPKHHCIKIKAFPGTFIYSSPDPENFFHLLFSSS